MFVEMEILHKHLPDRDLTLLGWIAFSARIVYTTGTYCNNLLSSRKLGFCGETGGGDRNVPTGYVEVEPNCYILESQLAGRNEILK